MSILGAIPDWIVAGAAAAAAWQGVKSLQAWRKETVGKRRIELAEDSLSDFYEFEQIILAVRSPIATTDEFEGREGRDSEDEGERRQKDAYYPVLNRLIERSEFFSRMFSRQYRVRAVFGTEAYELYQEALGIHKDLYFATLEAMELHVVGREKTDDEAAHEKKLRRTIWRVSKNDEYGLRIEALSGRAKTLFGGEIEERS